MTKKTNNQIAFEALEASEVAMEMHCKARGIDVIDLSDEDVDFFINTALVEVFSPHTRMSEIMTGARSDITIADLKAQLDKRQAKIQAGRNQPGE